MVQCTTRQIYRSYIYKIESIATINRFRNNIKHKSNVYSIELRDTGVNSFINKDEIELERIPLIGRSINRAAKRYEPKEDVDFECSKDFIEDGLLDSFEIVELVSALEDAFEIEISGRDIIPENFVSVETIEDMIDKYR